MSDGVSRVEPTKKTGFSVSVESMTVFLLPILPEPMELLPNRIKRIF
jgi:hypothetical protein